MSNNTRYWIVNFRTHTYVYYCFDTNTCETDISFDPHPEDREFIRYEPRETLESAKHLRAVVKSAINKRIKKLKDNGTTLASTSRAANELRQLCAADIGIERVVSGRVE